MLSIFIRKYNFSSLLPKEERPTSPELSIEEGEPVLKNFLGGIIYPKMVTVKTWRSNTCCSWDEQEEYLSPNKAKTAITTFLKECGEPIYMDLDDINRINMEVILHFK